MATFTTNLRVTKIAAGDESGTWGGTSNNTFDYFDKALGYATHANGDADETVTISDGGTADITALYVQVTGALTANRTITFGPNTLQKLWYVENATSGGFSVLIKQGTGAEITIAAGKTKIVYTDGAGAGAAVVDALATIAMATLDAETSATVDTLSLSTGSITDSTGAISFGNESLTTTGAIAAAAATFTGNLNVTATGPHAIGSATSDWIRLRLDGAFTSGGGNTNMVGTYIAGALTADAGDTDFHYGQLFANTITTAGNVTTVAQLTLAEPAITVGAGAVTNAATLYIASAPTEATNNYALFVDAGDVRMDARLFLPTSGTSGGIVFAGDTNLYRSAGNTLTTDDNFTVGGTLVTSTGLGNAIGAAALGLVGTRIGGSMTAGTGTSADGLRLTHAITVNDANTNATHMNVGQATGGSSMTTGGSGTAFSGSFVTAKFSEPDITLTGADTVATAATVLIVNAPTEATNNYALLVDAGTTRLDGVLHVNHPGPHGIGGSTDASIGVRFPAAFSSNGSGTASHVDIAGALTGTAGDTGELRQLNVAGTIITQDNSETIGLVSTLRVREPTITKGASDTITSAASVYISGAPTEATNNYALFVDAGDVRFDEDLEVRQRLLIGSSFGNSGWIGHNFHYDFTSDGSGTSAYMTWFGGDLTLANGDTTGAANVLINGHIITQSNSETIANVSSLTLVEPILTVGTDTVTDASTLWVSDHPTEGTNNYSILVSSGDFALRGDGRIIQATSHPTFDNRANVFDPDFTSDGSAATAFSSWFGGDLRLDSAETSGGGIVFMDGNIHTPGTTTTFNNIDTLTLLRPDITVGSGDTVTNTSVIRVNSVSSAGTNNYAILVEAGDVRFKGRMGLGETFLPHIGNWIATDFTSDGSGGGGAYGTLIGGETTGASGVTGHATCIINGTNVTQGLSQTIDFVASLYVVEPVITKGTGDTITDAMTLYVLGAPSEGATNHAIYVSAGRTTLPASTTSVAPLQIPHGSAPTSPVNGDIWTTTAGLYVRINGSTVGPLS